MRVYAMIVAMWSSILLGGGLLVALGPLSLGAATSAVQAAAACGMVAAWAVMFYSLARKLYGA